MINIPVPADNVEAVIFEGRRFLFEGEAVRLVEDHRETFYQQKTISNLLKVHFVYK